MNPIHHRKRTFAKGLALHVVFKSNYQVFWGVRAKASTDKILSIYGRHFGVKIYHRALVGHHIHLIIYSQTQEALHGFLRVVSGQISLSQRKSAGILGDSKSFWQSRPWSRLLQWGKDYGTALKYVALNYLEGTKAIIRFAKSRNELKRYERAIQEVLEKKLTQVQVA